MRTVLFLALLATSVSALADDVPYNPNRARQDLKVGDTLTFKLDAMPGAGYGWQPTTIGRPNMKYISVTTLPSQKGAIGGKQTMILKFLATAKGEATIALVYGRPWLIKKGEKPDKTLIVKVQVS
ncbi:MAG: protease inhibitor I42 family protein [Fimbriimonas sp.]